MLTVDIDTGGTMTDALVTDGARRHPIKVDTTPHDLTVSFMDCLAEAAKLYDEDVDAFLRRSRLIRWTSTITTNVIAERRGAKVGLLVSKGCEQSLYGDERSPVLDELVSADSVLGLSAQPDAREILMAVKSLLETGVRRICVCLRGSFPDNAAEVAVKRVIESQYPDHIIGSVPVLLGSEMAPIAHDQTRVHYSLMNAYTHTHLATSLFKAEDMLRDEHGWNGALLVGHTNGGVARIGKTKAVDTIESGPVFGTFGGACVAREYGLANVVCFDVGGTTTKASIVRDGEPVFQRGGELMEVPVRTSFAMVRSDALGGGSIARVRDGRLTLGPDSMGAAPGPACYGLGGREATLTDALLCLGYLDPARFLGGRRLLDIGLAREAIERHVAGPLGLAVEQAALAVRDEAVSTMAELIEHTLAEAGLAAADTVLFAFGGNGPMFGALVAERLDISSVYAFDFGPVFGAFGSSVSDVAHVYERGVGLSWSETHAGTIGAIAARLYQQATRDLLAEGFDPALASYRYELELGHDELITGSARFELAGAPDAGWQARAGAAIAAAGIDVHAAPVILLRLSSRYPIGGGAFAQRTNAGNGTLPAPVERPMIFDGRPAAPVPAYAWEQLGVGSHVSGPAMVNGATLTCPVPPQWNLIVDAYGNAHLHR